MARGLSTTLLTQLPAQYERLFAWNLDRRCKTVRDVAADLYELWQDLGGVENLSAQKRWLCERVVYLRRRCIAYETVMMHNADLEPGKEALPLPLEAGTYSNFANVLQGYLKTLGLERRTKSVERLRDVMRGAAEPKPERGAVPASDAQAAHDEMIRAGEAPADAPASEQSA
jgi:hypothetical protein